MSSLWASHPLGRNQPVVLPSTDDQPIQQSLGEFELKILACSSVYKKLLNIKYRYGHNDRVSADFKMREKHYSFDIPQTSFRDQFESIFADINDAVGGLFVGGNVQVFLDLGCAPGGFSKFIMDNNPKARGVGITLPDIPVLTEGTPLADTNRYRLETCDITTLNFDAQTYRPPSARVKLEEGGHDLIIAGAFPTGKLVSAASRAILALSQLHAILSNLQSGATCVIVANTKPFLWNVEMFGVLRRVFQNIQPAKHRKLHAIRSSCYFVCTGFGVDNEEALSFKRRVKCALNVLKDIGREGDKWTDELLIFSGVFDLDNFFSSEYLFFLDIMEPLWEKQFTAIEAKLAQVHRNPNRRSFGGCSSFRGFGDRGRRNYSTYN